MANSSYFANSHSFVIESGGNLATVHGNQIINYFNREPEKPTALTIYNQFRQVILGDICRTKDLGVSKYPRRWDVGGRRSWELRADRTTCTAQVIGGEGRVFTVVSYTGPEAREAFERDFQMYANTRSASPFQVYGINTSVPTVLFYDERQPAAKFIDGLGYWAKRYLETLIWREFSYCNANEIWLDPKKGELCRGPATGPNCELRCENLQNSPGVGSVHLLSCSAEFLQDDNVIRFLATHKPKDVDRWATEEIVDHRNLENIGEVAEVEVHQTTIFSTSTNATIAGGAMLWAPLCAYHVKRSEVMANDGATRFTFENMSHLWGYYLNTTSGQQQSAWMSQALSIFHRRGISLDDDLSQYTLIFPAMQMKKPPSSVIRTEKPIYLFIHPLSTPAPKYQRCWSSSFHHWSFDPTGQPPLSPEVCQSLSLPTELIRFVEPTLQYRWNNETYKLMRQYQLVRGFDPTTTDFARHLGYPIYQVHNDSDRFEDPRPTNKARKVSGLGGHGRRRKARISPRVECRVSSLLF